MRLAARGAAVAVATLAAFLSLVLLSTSTAALKLLASGATVLVMGGTGHSLSPTEDSNQFVQDYMASAVGNYVAPAGTLDTGVPGGPYNTVAVITPEQSAPRTGTLTFDESVALGQQNLDSCIRSTSCPYNDQVGSVPPIPGETFVVYGFSQSSTVATLEKRALAAAGYAPGEGPDVSFVLVANGNRPNGGFLARGPEGVTVPSLLPFGGATFNGSTPTDTQYDTVDIAAQYDAWSDFPVNPLNLLAVANAMMGVDYLHLGGTYDNTTLTDPGVVDQGQYQDTHYYLISTPVLPLLMPLEKFGPLGHALADTLDAPLRVIVESAYDRTTSPGVPTSWNALYFPNPVKFARNLIVAVPTGWDNGIQDLFGVRPFRTTRPGPYGVGGPDVTYTAPDATTGSSSAAADAKTVAAAQEPTVKKSTGGFKPRPTTKATATKTAAAAAATQTDVTVGGKDSKGSDKDTAKSTTAKSTTSKHNNGVGGSKRAKAAAGASS